MLVRHWRPPLPVPPFPVSLWLWTNQSMPMPRPTGDPCCAGVWVGPRPACRVQALGRGQCHVRPAARVAVRYVLRVSHGTSVQGSWLVGREPVCTWCAWWAESECAPGVLGGQGANVLCTCLLGGLSTAKGCPVCSTVSSLLCAQRVHATRPACMPG